MGASIKFRIVFPNCRVNKLCWIARTNTDDSLR